MGEVPLKKLMGRLLAARYEVHLLSDILDTPEFFWERPELHLLNEQCMDAIQLREREGVLNRRLEVVNDVLTTLDGVLVSRKGHWAEMWIIYLIVLEVVLSLVHLEAEYKVVARYLGFL